MLGICPSPIQFGQCAMAGSRGDGLVEIGSPLNHG
jgi:hypothetical protein